MDLTDPIPNSTKSPTKIGYDVGKKKDYELDFTQGQNSGHVAKVEVHMCASYFFERSLT